MNEILHECRCALISSLVPGMQAGTATPARQDTTIECCNFGGMSDVCMILVQRFMLQFQAFSYDMHMDLRLTARPPLGLVCSPQSHKRKYGSSSQTSVVTSQPSSLHPQNERAGGYVKRGMGDGSVIARIPKLIRAEAGLPVEGEVPEWPTKQAANTPLQVCGSNDPAPRAVRIGIHRASRVSTLGRFHVTAASRQHLPCRKI